MTDDNKKESNYGAMQTTPLPMESIAEGQALTGAAPPPVVAHPPPPQGHRRHRSRGGDHHHSRSASLVDSLADILQTIDEVAVERPGDHLRPAAAAVDDDNSGSAVPPTHRHSRAGRHSRTASLSEGLLEEVQDIRDAFVEELDKADEGEKEFFFLDMSLARQISILPEDMVRVAEVTAPIEGGEAEESTDPEKHPLKGDEIPEAALTTQTTIIPLNAYLLLASAVVALSSVGPLLNVQMGINPVLKVYWRMSATAMCLFPFAASSVYNEGGIGVATKSLHGPQIVTLLLTAACYATMCVAFVLALKYTAVGNAVILSNSQSVLLLIGKIFVGHRILALEAGGAMFAFSGAALCSIDSAGQEGGGGGGGGGGDNDQSNMTLVGDSLALLSALGGVFYLTFAKAVRPHLNLYLFMFLVMFCGSTLILICMLFYAFTSEPGNFHVSIDRNIVSGIWGWMNFRYDRLPLELTMVILCNIFGAMVSCSIRKMEPRNHWSFY